MGHESFAQRKIEHDLLRTTRQSLRQSSSRVVCFLAGTNLLRTETTEKKKKKTSVTFEKWNKSPLISVLTGFGAASESVQILPSRNGGLPKLIERCIGHGYCTSKYPSCEKYTVVVRVLLPAGGSSFSGSTPGRQKKRRDFFFPTLPRGDVYPGGRVNEIIGPPTRIDIFFLTRR